MNGFGTMKINWISKFTLVSLNPRVQVKLTGLTDILGATGLWWMLPIIASI